MCSRGKRREQGGAGEEIGGHRGVGADRKWPGLRLQGLQPLLCWWAPVQGVEQRSRLSVLGESLVLC